MRIIFIGLCVFLIASFEVESINYSEMSDSNRSFNNVEKKVNPYLLPYILWSKDFYKPSQKNPPKEKNSKHVTCIYTCVLNGKLVDMNLNGGQTTCEHKLTRTCRKIKN